MSLLGLGIGTPKIYTTTGLGPRKNREMAGVDDLVVYIQTAVFYISLHIPKSSTPAISLFFLGPNPVVVYIFGVPIKQNKSANNM